MKIRSASNDAKIFREKLEALIEEFESKTKQRISHIHVRIGYTEAKNIIIETKF